MLKNSVKNSFWIAIAFFCATRMSYAQGNGPTVRTVRRQRSDEHRTERGRQHDNGRRVQAAQERGRAGKACLLDWYVDAGYESEYNFRGTNLTPNANGAGFFDARVTKWNFTLGLFGIHQFGHARADSWSIGEGGGSAEAAGAMRGQFPGGDSIHSLPDYGPN